jgi:23S rRNA (uracil1939-C5)-methyltransferase
LADVDEIEVEVEKLVAGGHGLARWRGVPIFIPRSAPGDRLRVRIVERRTDYGRAEIVEILAPGEGRRSPPCPHFGTCGGCDLQHLEDALQADLKASAVRETLGRLGRVASSVPTELIRGAAWAYRQRAQVHTTGRDEDVQVGFFSRRGRAVVQVESCPVLVPELESLIPNLVEALPAAPPRRIDLLVGDDGALSSAPRAAGLPHREVSITVGRYRYELDARCFFQAHRELLPRLVEEVVGPWKGRQAFDLYAGVGLFSLPLAGRYDQVLAIEGDGVAGRFLRRNARRERTESLDFEHSAVESWIDRLPADTDRVVVDPPRTGLSRRIREQLARRRPRRLTYVSCHAATLARDLKILSEVFEIEKISMFDLFPQTGHMETVAHLVVKGPPGSADSAQPVRSSASSSSTSF